MFKTSLLIRYEESIRKCEIINMIEVIQTIILINFSLTWVIYGN